MKIITPPAITNLDELLDVVLHPDKLATALKQMAAMRDAIAEQLALFPTKQKADDYLAQAQAMQQEARRLTEVTLTKAKDNEAQCKERLDQLARDQDAWTKAKEQEQAALKARKDEVTAKEYEIMEKAAGLNELEAALNERDAELSRLGAKLTAELEKMEQRKALLNAV